jgi:prophage regulatory protein
MYRRCRRLFRTTASPPISIENCFSQLRLFAFESWESIASSEFRRSDMLKRILRLPAVQARTGLSRSTIYARISAGTFVAPIKIGPNSIGWIESEVEAWIEMQVAASRPPAEMLG